MHLFSSSSSLFDWTTLEEIHSKTISQSDNKDTASFLLGTVPTPNTTGTMTVTEDWTAHTLFDRTTVAVV